MNKRQIYHYIKRRISNNVPPSQIAEYLLDKVSEEVFDQEQRIRDLKKEVEGLKRQLEQEKGSRGIVLPFY